MKETNMPNKWEIPAQPNNVKTVNDKFGDNWTYLPEFHQWENSKQTRLGWSSLLIAYGPLEEVKQQYAVFTLQKDGSQTKQLYTTGTREFASSRLKEQAMVIFGDLDAEKFYYIAGEYLNFGNRDSMTTYIVEEV